MRNAYQTLFESMLSWYGKRYPNIARRLIVTSMAMSLMMVFNLSSLSNILAAVGHPTLAAFLGATRVRVVGIGLLLVLINYHLGRRQIGLPSRTLHYADVAPAPKKYAVAYVVGSLAVYALSVVWAIATDPN